MSIEPTSDIHCVGDNNSHMIASDTSSSNNCSVNTANCKSNTEKHSNLKKAMQSCNLVEELDRPSSTVGDITLMKDLVSEYFTEAFPLMERSRKQVKELSKIANAKQKASERENVKKSLMREYQEHQVENKQQSTSSTSSFVSFWKVLQTLNLLNRSQSSYKYFCNSISPEFASYSANVQPPVVTSTEVDHFLSTMSEDDRTLLLQEYEQQAEHNIEYTMESEQKQTLHACHLEHFSNEKNNLTSDEKLEQCDARVNPSARENIHTSIVDIDKSNLNEKKAQEQYIENEDSMSRYKNAWFTEPDDSKAVDNIAKISDSSNCDSNVSYHNTKQVEMHEEEEKERAELTPIEKWNEEEAHKENSNANEEKKSNSADDVRTAQQDAVHVMGVESQEHEQSSVSEQNEEESDDASMEESFDQFSRRVLAREEWTKNLHASDQNTQSSNVVKYFDHTNITLTPISLEEEKQPNDNVNEEEPYEWLEEEEFVIPPVQRASSPYRSEVQEKMLNEFHESEKQVGSNERHNKTESVKSQSSLVSLSSTDATKCKRDVLHQDDKLPTSATLDTKKNSTKVTVCQESKSHGWRSYLTNMVTRKDASTGNTAISKEVKVSSLHQPVHHVENYCHTINKTKEKRNNNNNSSNGTAVLEEKTRAQTAYLRKRAYDILLANKVRKHDEQVYTHHLHETMETQAELLVSSMLPLLNQLTIMVRQSCALLDVVAELDRASFGATVASPSQYLTTPRFRLRCAEVTCQALFSTTVTRITCRRCGEVYCPRCCTERGVGPDVTCLRPHSVHHANNSSNNVNGKCNANAFLLQAEARDRRSKNDYKLHDSNTNKEETNITDKDENCAIFLNDKTHAERNTKVENTAESFYHTSSSNKVMSSLKEKQLEREEHISLGWEPICMRCWRVCAENVRRVVMERRRRSLVHASHNNSYYNNNNNNNNRSNSTSQDHNNYTHSTKSNITMNSNEPSTVISASDQAHFHDTSTTPLSTLHTLHHSISLEELSVKEAVLLGAYCDNELRLHDGFAPFYVMTDCSRESIASWDVVAYKLSRVGSAWRTHWQDAGKWAALALHYTRMQSELGIANLRTQVKWRKILENFKQGALSTKKLLLEQNKHLPRIVHRINKSAKTIESAKESCASKSNKIATSRDNKDNNDNEEVDNDDDFVEDDYDEATLLNYFNRNTEDNTLSEFSQSLHIMTA